MNPLEPKKTVSSTKKEGADVFIVLDISNSMLAEDIKPNRLEKAKQIIKTLLLKFGSDRVGVVLFAGDAFVYLPLTIDLGMASMMISEADPLLIQPQGTNINKALTTTFYAIERSRVKKPFVIVFSDGENFEEDPHDILKRYADSKIPIYVVALGTPEGAPIPLKQNSDIIGYKRDRNGDLVITRPNIMLLSSIATATNGILIDQQNLNRAHEILFDEIKKYQYEKGVEVYIGQYQSVYLWFLIPAFVLLLIDFLMSEHKDKWQFNFQRFINKNIDL
jgi:Ca-activated chloride channel family protein